MLIWTENNETGVWNSEPFLPPDTRFSNEREVARMMACVRRGEQELICFMSMDFSEHITVVSVNMNDKSLKTLFTVGDYSRIHLVRALGVFDSKWLVFSIRGDGGRSAGGLYVYNLETNGQTDFWDAAELPSMFGMQPAAECSKTFWTYCAKRCAALGFRLDEDGRLSKANFIYGSPRQSEEGCSFSV